jgi:hypothetical protein
MFGRLVVERVVRIGRTQKGLDREEDSSDLQSRAPVCFEDVETDSAEVVDIWVINLRVKNTLGRRHRVVIWEKQLCIEFASFIRSSWWAIDFDNEMPEVGWISFDFDSWDLLFFQILCLLCSMDPPLATGLVSGGEIANENYSGDSRGDGHCSE